MAEEAALRAQLDDQRDRIGDTVDQIENRVRPGRVVRRKRGQLTGRISHWKDQVMGSDDPSGSSNGSGSSMSERASDLASTVSGTPDVVRRRTRGNPVAPGLIAFGAGLLVAAVLPETRREQQLVHKVQPELDQFASDAGTDIGRDVQESAREAASSVKDTATSAASDAAQESKDAVARAT